MAAKMNEHPATIEGKILRRLDKRVVTTIGSNARNTFLPRQAIEEVLTADLVGRWVLSIASLNDTSASRGYGDPSVFNFARQKSITDMIMTKGRGILAVLVRIGRASDIHRFFFRTGPGPGLFDEDMPLPTDFDATGMEKLLDEQFLVFGIPNFDRSLSLRSLSKDVRMPFLEEKSIGEGAFGTVYKTTIHSSHDHLPDEFKAPNHVYVRKSLKDYHDTRPRRSTRELFLNEVKVLNNLSQSRHNHMITLLCSYTRGIEYSMILPFALGDLEKYLSEDTLMVYMSSLNVKRQLLGLADAIKTLHYFEYPDADTGKTISNFGYHHDLKPSNILVLPNKLMPGARFVLGDFGTARLKDTQLYTSSKTTWKQGAEDYSPPEAQGISEEDPTRFDSKVNRKIDIWSIGCIYIEILTHLSKGPTKVENFRNFRRTKGLDSEGYTITSRFFHDFNDVKPEVRSWLVHLRGLFMEDLSVLEVITVIENNMLIADPDKRSTSEIVVKLMGIALDLASPDMVVG